MTNLRAEVMGVIDSFFREHNQHATELVSHPILIRELKREALPEDWHWVSAGVWKWQGVTLVEDDKHPHWVARIS